MFRKTLKEKKGSMIVEMTLILPVCLAVFFGIVYLSFYIYNEAVCKASCYEMAFCAARDGADTQQYGKAEAFMRNSTIAMKNLQIQTNITDKEAQVSAAGVMQMPLLPIVVQIHTGETVAISHPAQTIRDVRWGKSLFE